MPGAIIVGCCETCMIAGVAAVELEPLQRLVSQVDFIAASTAAGSGAIDAGIRIVGGLGLGTQAVQRDGHGEGVCEFLTESDLLAALPCDQRCARHTASLRRGHAAQIIAVKAAPGAEIDFSRFHGPKDETALGGE